MVCLGIAVETQKNKGGRHGELWKSVRLYVCVCVGGGDTLKLDLQITFAM